MFFQRLWTCCRVGWNLFRVTLQMVYGAWKISSLPQPIVTIFGGSRFTQDDPYARNAHTLAQMFANEGISVLTGGGGGIMQAAVCEIKPPKGGKQARTMGIGVTGLENPNPCVQNFLMLKYFFARKWLMTRFAQAFVVFPGGYGTMDELYEVLVLIQIKKMPKVPVILVGSEYWKLWLEWINKEMLGHGLIRDEDPIFTVTDSLDDIVCLVRSACEPIKK